MRAVRPLSVEIANRDGRRETYLAVRLAIYFTL
jgi:hypothetical protein